MVDCLMVILLWSQCPPKPSIPGFSSFYLCMQTLSRVEDLVAACDERQIGDKLRVNKSFPEPLTISVRRKCDGCYLYTNSLLGTHLYLLLALSIGQRLCIDSSVFKSKFPNHFVFTLGCYLLLLFLVQFV